MQPNHWFEYDPHNEKIGVLLPGKLPLVITKEDVDVSYFSGGHGGQNLNRHMNGVRLIYRIPSKYQLSFKKTKEIISKSIGQRSREQNFKEAFKHLAEKVELYFYMPPHRKATRVPNASKLKRIAEKKLRGQLKEQRGKVDI